MTITVNGFYIKACNLIDLNFNFEAQEIINKCLISNIDPLFRLKFELLNFENNQNLSEEYCQILKEFLHITKASFDYENTELVLDKLIDYYELKSSYKTANNYLKEKIKLIETKFSN